MCNYELYHPTFPRPLAAMSILQRMLDGDVPLTPYQKVLNDVGNRYLRAAFILRLQDYPANAEHAEAIVVNRVETIWKARDRIFRRCQDDPKLGHLMNDEYAESDGSLGGNEAQSQNAQTDLLEYLSRKRKR